MPVYLPSFLICGFLLLQLGIAADTSGISIVILNSNNNCCYLRCPKAPLCVHEMKDKKLVHVLMLCSVVFTCIKRCIRGQVLELILGTCISGFCEWLVILPASITTVPISKLAGLSKR